jgi:hypothetical protein
VLAALTDKKVQKSGAKCRNDCRRKCILTQERRGINKLKIAETGNHNNYYSLLLRDSILMYVRLKNRKTDLLLSRLIVNCTASRRHQIILLKPGTRLGKSSKNLEIANAPSRVCCLRLVKAPQ